ncbi:MAG: diphthamide biosynthesis enzyme Dph2 [Halobacteriales archaeon]|nr:diphthamide biosynthesis enzyme Dph2 [Halobacteriales archaeon]
MSSTDASRSPEPWDETYDLDLEEVWQRVRQRGAKRVLLQFPDGLRDYAPGIAKLLTQRTGAEAVLSGEACYGACDTPSASALHAAGADLLVQFGHSPMPSVPVKDTMFVRAKYRMPIRPAIAKAVGELGLRGKRVGFVTTAQYAHKTDEAIAILHELGVEAKVGKGDLRIALAAQILGCNYTAAKAVEPEVDLFFYLGSGDFHPLGLALETPKDVVVADPEFGTVRLMSGLRDKVLRQRFAAIETAKRRGGKRFALLVSTKAGQFRLRLAEQLQRRIEAKGGEAVIVQIDTFTPDALQYFRHMDAWVNTACPRIATDDYAKWPVPMLTPPELEMVLGERAWEHYVFDEIAGDKKLHSPMFD